VLYISAFCYIEFKRSSRDILWVIVLLLLISNIGFVTYTTVGNYINAACIDNHAKSDGLLIANCLAFGIAILFFNLGYWLLYYKYWEVSWTVPLQIRGIQPSLKMTRNIKRGQTLGVVLISLGAIVLVLVILISTTHKNMDSCYLYDSSSQGWASIVCLLNVVG